MGDECEANAFMGALYYATVRRVLAYANRSLCEAHRTWVGLFVVYKGIGKLLNL